MDACTHFSCMLASCTDVSVLHSRIVWMDDAVVRDMILQKRDGECYIGWVTIGKWLDERIGC